MTQAEIFKIIDTRRDMLKLTIAENTDTDFNLNYTWEYARRELERLKLVIKYEEDKKNG